MNRKSINEPKKRKSTRLLQIAVLVCLFLTELVVAQGNAEEKVTIRGVVVDTNDPPTPLTGATIMLKGTTTGTVSDVSGFFSIQANKGDTLVFSYLGYKEKTFRVVKNEANLSIALAEEALFLDQVVVTGMTSQKRSQIASSVGIVTTKNFDNKPITRLSQALQGGTTGIYVSQNSGLPGGDAATIKIRGVATLLGSDPLIIIDGFESDMNKLDPATVESITVLKDASAASIYGAKAGNGVIVITTKRGVAGKVTVGYNGYYGIQEPMYLPEFVDAPQYMDYINIASANSGGAVIFSPEAISMTREGTDPVLYPNTNWRKETMKNTSPIQEHNLQVSGGNTTARFALSAQYLCQDGMYKGQYNGFDRLAVRLNTSVNLTKSLYTYVDAFVNRDKRTEITTSTGLSLLDYIYRVPPNIAAKYPAKEGQEDYTYYGVYKEFQNPVLHLERGGFEELFRDYVTLNIRPVWHATETFTLKGQFGYRLSSGLTRSTRMPYEILDYWTDGAVYEYSQVNSSEYPARSSFWMAGLNFDYSIRFNKEHKLNLIGGWNTESDIRNAWDEVTLVSYFGKVFYSYLDKYFLELTGRRDGSSLFNKGHKWGTFPSVAAGWNLHEEAFLQSQEYLSNLKLRLSYGVLGNNRVNPYRYQNIVNSAGSEIVNGNPDLTWEKVAIWNAGIDVSTFHSNFDLTVDVFKKITTDLIINVPSTLSSGLLSSYVNAGKAEVKGFEVGASYKLNINTFSDLNLNVGYSFNRSELLQINQDRLVSGNRIHQVGKSISEHYGYKADGLLSQEDIDSHYPIIGGYEAETLAQFPGDVKYIDEDGDEVITDNDKVALGNTEPQSVYYAGISFTYKNLDFETQINGVGSVPVFYSGLISNPLDGDTGGTPQTWHLNYWTPDHPNARLPRPTNSPGNNGLFSSFWKEDGKFIRIRYIQLGYKIPYLARKIKAENLRIYVNLQNPFTFSSLDLIDPETKGNHSTHPMFKTYSVGLNIRF